MKRRRPRRLFGFLATVAWVIPCMVIMLAAGFFLARDLVAPRMLEKSEFRTSHPRPKRILTPEEGREMVNRNEESHVWTEGVRPSDIPKLIQTEQPRGWRSHRKPTDPKSSVKPTKTTPDPMVAPSTAPSTAPPPANNTGGTPAPTTPPATGGGATETPQ